MRESELDPRYTKRVAMVNIGMITLEYLNGIVRITI